ncbi:MAG: hypothetical protein JNL39_04650 [Opitutaceae bacterium]|nr:hypothetical protein [Opitutaceae bacterium]
MSASAAFLTAAVTGVFGLIATGIVTSALNDWLHFYPRGDVGTALMTVLISAAGGVVFFIFGYVVSSIVAGQPGAGFARAAGISCGSVLALSVAVLVIGRSRADVPPKIDGKELALAIELRPPTGFTPPQRPDESTTGINVLPANHRTLLFGPLNHYRAKQVDGQWTISTKVHLGTSAAEKVLVVRLGPDTTLTFALPLRAHPDQRDTEWSAWLEADAGPAAPAPAKKFRLRYRVRGWGRTNEDFEAEEAQKAEAEQSRFDALGVHTPIAELLPYTRSNASPKHVTAAVQLIVSRPNYVDEITALMVGDTDKSAVMALEFVAQLPPPQSALLPPVAAAGRDIARRIRETNANAKAGEDYPAGADSVFQRFNAWLPAVRALRQTSGGDFTPELGEILKLSRLRPETFLFTDFVRRKASQAMKEWAGAEPLPGDLPAP